MASTEFSCAVARFRRRTALAAAAVALLAGCAPVTPVSPSASPEPWPPMMLANDQRPLPALVAAHARCNILTIKHEWTVLADMSYGADRQSLIINERSHEWIEAYYHHPIDHGTRHSTYNQKWIEEYLKHPLPDGYFIWAGQTCVLSFLGAPPHIVDDMIATTPEMSEQEATWGNFKGVWTNADGTGPDVVFSYHHPGEAGESGED